MRLPRSPYSLSIIAAQRLPAQPADFLHRRLGPLKHQMPDLLLLARWLPEQPRGRLQVQRPVPREARAGRSRRA